MQKIKISELPECEDLAGLYTIGYSETEEGTDGGGAETVRTSVRFPLTGVADAADAANSAAEKAEKAATNAENAMDDASEAAIAANSAANNADLAADRANEAAEKAEKAAEGAGGDYLPLTGGTLTGDLTVDARLTAKTFSLGEGSIFGDTSSVTFDTRYTYFVSGNVIYESGVKVSFREGSTLTLDLSSNFFVNCTAEFQEGVLFYGQTNHNALAKFNAQTDFCGGTYIDTDGHIHLPSGVEIY